MKESSELLTGAEIESDIFIEKNCVIIYTSFLQYEIHHGFFFKSKEPLLKSEFPNYHASILILHYFVGCPVGYFGQHCSKPCVYPSFGERCQRECNCTEEICNIITGCEGFNQI